MPVAGTPPPHSLEHEAALLGSVITDPAKLDDVSDILRPEHFYSGRHGILYGALLAIRGRNDPIDAVTILGQLRDTGKLVEVGGAEEVKRIIFAEAVIQNVRTYAVAIVDKWRLRQAIRLCHEHRELGYRAVADPQAYLESLAQQAHTLAHDATGDTLEALTGPMAGAIKRIEDAAKAGKRITGISTGYDYVDNLTGGLHDGDATIIAARPGKGKTSYMLGVAANVAKQGYYVPVFSMEMPKEQLAYRYICMEGRVDLARLRIGALTRDDWQRVHRAKAAYSQLKLWVDDKAGLTVAELRSKVRRVQARAAREGRKVGAVVVDYLQLMRGTAQAIRHGREREVAEVAQDLKNLAKDLKVPVIAGCQVSRGIEHRGDHARPVLADLRESGNIEQAFDNVAFLHENGNIVELIYEKQRNGPQGTVAFRWDGRYTRFDQELGEDNGEQ